MDGAIDRASIAVPGCAPIVRVPVKAPPDGLEGSPPDDDDLLEYCAAS